MQTRLWAWQPGSWAHSHLSPPFPRRLVHSAVLVESGQLWQGCILHLCCLHVPGRLIAHNSAPDTFLPAGSLLSQAPAGIMSTPLFNKSEFISLTISDHRLVSC